MADKETLTARMPADTYKRVEQYRKKRDLTKSDAGRRLVESGLDHETGVTDSPAASNLVLLLLSALIGALIGLGTLTHGPVGLVVLFVAAAVGGAVGKLVLKTNGVNNA